jgi:nitrate/nitrite transporter NarK
MSISSTGNLGGSVVALSVLWMLELKGQVASPKDAAGFERSKGCGPVLFPTFSMFLQMTLVLNLLLLVLAKYDICAVLALKERRAVNWYLV